jgi:hypothetical protein
MSVRLSASARWCVPLALVLLIVAASPLALRGAAAPSDTPQIRTLTGVPVDPVVSHIWNDTDEPIASSKVARSWLWGPHALSSSVEYTEDSPALRRSMVYFDKARLDVLDPSLAADHPWYVTGALLVVHMLSGEIPFGDGIVAQRESPHIPVAGDPDQPGALTYAALGPRASIAGKALRGGDPVPVAPSLVGREIRDMLAGNGQVIPDAFENTGVVYGAYDEVTGHNIAKPFADWIVAQQYAPNWLIGRPLTEPYWVEVTVAGLRQRVMLQAFERRVLTYTPGNAPEWRVESGNAGQHYRIWRGLQAPSHADHISLASLEPFGEEIVAAATRHGVDPFMLAAVAQASSFGNPGASQANGGIGLMAVRGEGNTSSTLIDPARNADLAAAELARWVNANGGADWPAILANYFSGGVPNWDDADLTGLVDATLNAYAVIVSTHPVVFEQPVAQPPASTPTPVPPVETPAPPAPPTTTGRDLGTGRAAYYSASYDVAWWERTMRLYDSWGSAVKGWQYDPNGHYCVHPDFKVGQRLQLEANGVTLTCTIGDTVQAAHVASWRSKWVVELSWHTFQALGLDKKNTVTVRAVQ